MDKERYYYVVYDFKDNNRSGKGSFLSVLGPESIPSINNWAALAAEQAKEKRESVVVTNFIEVDYDFAKQYCEEYGSDYFKVKEAKNGSDNSGKQTPSSDR